VRGATQGLVAGAVAGFLLAFVELLAARGDVPPLFRVAGGIVLGPDASDAALTGAGFVASLVPATIWGGLYALAVSRASPASRASLGAGAIRGVLWGTLAWFVDLMVVGRLFVPGGLGSPTAMSWLLHAGVYGVALGLLFALQERPIHAQRVAR
jgi:hypothetical protein